MQVVKRKLQAHIKTKEITVLEIGIVVTRGKFGYKQSDINRFIGDKLWQIYMW